MIGRVPSEVYPPGEEVVGPIEGDFFLSHGLHLESKLIRAVQRRRYRGVDRSYAWFNHAGLFVGRDGEIIESLPTGITERNISRYRADDYVVVRTGQMADEHDREQMVAFARAMVGQHFGWLSMFGGLISILFGTTLGIDHAGHTVCSGFVARCLERSSFICMQSPDSILPAELARMFRVQRP